MPIHIRMAEQIEVQVIVDGDGVKCVRIVGPSQEHASGHDLYFRIRDLIKAFDTAIQERFKEVKEKDERSNKEKFDA